MGSVNARSGKLFFDFRFQGIRCREYATLEDTAPNRRKMEKVLEKIEAEIALGTFEYSRFFPGSKMAARFEAPKPGPAPQGIRLTRSAERKLEAPALPKFADFARQWQSDRRVEWRQSYQTSVDRMLSTQLIPRFGELTMDAIDRASVLAFRKELADKRIGADPDNGVEGHPPAPATINRVLGILRMILEESAQRHGTQNPMLAIKRLKLQRVDIEPFTVEEVQMIIGRVRADYRPYLTLRFFTGVRSSEAHGLKWKCVDFERRQVLIRETWQGSRTEYTKTDGSQRDIRMSQPVFEALQLMRPEGYARDPDRFAEDYVFRTGKGKPIDNNNFNDRVWKPLLRNLGFKYRRPYQMRHTCATLWLAAGEAPEWIARQLGHTTTEMLFRTYSRYVPNLMRRDGSAFDTFVAGVTNGGITLVAGGGLPLGKPKIRRKAVVVQEEATHEE